MANEQGYILLGADGEPHTEGALNWALDLAIRLGLGLKAVHVRDPYLKQFYNDIYAQGREEYLAHVQDCIVEKAEQASAAFEASVRDRLDREDRRPDLEWSFEILDGDPAKRFTELVEERDVAMVVLGRKQRARIAAFRSRDLGERLSAIGCPVPVLVVPRFCP